VFANLSGLFVLFKPESHLKAAEIFVFGDVNLDVSMLIPAMPSPGQDVYVDSLVSNLGGSATNTGIVLTQLGYHARILGSIGMDPAADYLLKTLTAYGLDTDSVHRKRELPSGQIFLTIQPDGERTMYSYRGANVLTTPEDIPLEQLRQASLVHISGYTFLERPQRDTALQLIEIAHQYGIPISMDTGMDPVVHAHARLKPILKYLHLCICGQYEGSLLTGKESPEEIINALFDQGVRCSAIKLGKQGCVIGLDGNIHSSPALSIPVVDTTGSGDAFSAGVLIGWLNHFSLQEMCSLGNALGAYAATQLGPITATLGWAKLIAFLEQNRSSQTMTVQSGMAKLVVRLKAIEPVG
jgi:ribokinase